MAKVSIKGILDCYPQLAKDNAESGRYYVLVTEETETPDAFLPVVNVPHAARGKFAKDHSSHKCKSAGLAIYISDQNILNGCVPGDNVELTADLYAVSRPRWEETSQAVKYYKIPDRILVLDGKIKKVKPGNAA